MEPRYFHHFVGGNFRLDEIQAAILNVKLPYLDGWSAARRAAADRYREEFARRGLTSHLRLPAEPFRERGLTNHHIYHQYVIGTQRRDALRHHLTRNGIGSAIYYPLGLHQQKCFQYLGYREGDLPETERAARETLALPIYPEITREEQLFVVDIDRRNFLPGMASAGRLCSGSAPGQKTCDQSWPSLYQRSLWRPGRYRSGQTGRTVNPLAYAFAGSNPALPISGRSYLPAACVDNAS